MDQLQYLDKNGHLQTDRLVTWGLATCHNVSQSDVGLVGNEVEVKMFSVTGWNLIQMSGQPTRVVHAVDAGQQLAVVRVNEFEHARRSMSVVALDESSGELHVFCKVRGFRMRHASCVALEFFVHNTSSIDPVPADICELLYGLARYATNIVHCYVLTSPQELLCGCELLLHKLWHTLALTM